MAVVITHPEMGIYLGCCMGMGFWSKLDPVGQPTAVTFDTVHEAHGHMARWEDGPPEGVTTHPVVPDQPNGYASIEACVQAGLEGWLTDKPTAEYERQH